MALDIFGGIFSGGAGGASALFGTLFWVAIIGIPAIGIIGFIIWYIYKKKLWNLDVEFKLPRSDGKFVNAEWGKGYYNIKRGVVFLKRKKKKKIPMKPFNIAKFLQGQRILTVVQTGPSDYMPVLNHSWMKMESDKPLRDENGKLRRGDDGKAIYERVALLNTRVDAEKSKSWKNAFEREAKAAYSIISLLERYAPFIGVALILLFNFVGFAILWSKAG